jgi:hypothetical protein
VPGQLTAKQENDIRTLQKERDVVRANAPARKPVTRSAVRTCPDCKGVGHKRAARSVAPAAPAPAPRHYTAAERRAVANRLRRDGAASDPETVSRMSYAAKRDFALSVLERDCRSLSPSAVDRIDALLRRTDGDVSGRKVADWVIACGTQAYADVFRKSLTETNPAWSFRRESRARSCRPRLRSGSRAASARGRAPASSDPAESTPRS